MGYTAMACNSSFSHAPSPVSIAKPSCAVDFGRLLPPAHPVPSHATPSRPVRSRPVQAPLGHLSTFSLLFLLFVFYLFIFFPLPHLHSLLILADHPPPIPSRPIPSRPITAWTFMFPPILFLFLFSLCFLCFQDDGAVIHAEPGLNLPVFELPGGPQARTDGTRERGIPGG